MNKLYIQRVILLLIVMSMFCFCGCKKTTKTETVLHLKEGIDLSEKYQNMLVTPAVKPVSDMVFSDKEDIVFVGQTDKGFAVYRWEKDNSTLKELPLLLEQVPIKSTLYNEQFYFLLNEEGGISLNIYGLDGRKIIEHQYIECLNEKASSTIRTISSNGDVVSILSDGELFIVNLMGTCVDSAACPGIEFMDCAFDDDELYVLYSPEAGDSILIHKKSMKDKFEEIASFTGTSRISVMNNCLLIMDEKYLYKYIQENNELVKAVELSFHSIIPYKVLCITSERDNYYQFVVWDVGQTDKPVEMLILSDVEDDKQEKTIIRLTGISKDLLELQYGEVIAAFNKQSTDYKVVIDAIDSEGFSTYDIETIINSRIVAHDSPDLLVLYTGMSYETYARKGALVDITPFVMASTTLNIEDYDENLLQYFRISDSLYGIPKYFGITSFGTYGSKVGENPGWTVREFLEYYKENPCVWYGYSPSKEDILSFCLKGNLEQYLDFEEGKAYFNSDNFKEILANIEKIIIPNNPETLENQNLIEMYSFSSINHLEDIIRNTYGDEFVYKGYPNDTGMPVYYFETQTIHIIQNSKNKEGAYAFWEFYMNYQDSDYNERFSSKTKEFENMLEQHMEKHSLNMLDENMHMIQFSLSEKQASNLKNVILQASYESSDSVNIINIILDEAEEYFYGQKSLDEVCDVMNNRVQLYLDEG